MLELWHGDHSAPLLGIDFRFDVHRLLLVGLGRTPNDMENPTVDSYPKVKS